MGRIRSFPPLADPQARTLILGSMPGEASLRAACYYAHPHNQFWSILGAVLDFPPDAAYAERGARLCAAGIAVWDVLQSCERAGSLDSAIVGQTAQANDFAAFFAHHPLVSRVLFNGSAAEQLFARHVKRRQSIPEHLVYLRLPSTSPAHASLRPAEKLAHWRAALLT